MTTEYKIIETLSNIEYGIEALILEYANGLYSVTYRDSDAQQSVGSVHKIKSYESALKYASEFVA